MNLNEEKIIKSGNRLGWIILTILAVIIISGIIIIMSIYKMFTPPILRKYYVLDVNDNNKEEVTKLIEEEKENMFGIETYCDSIYKIEYYNGFPDVTDYTIYCENEDNISFGMDSLDADNLSKYIREKGYTEKR